MTPRKVEPAGAQVENEEAEPRITELRPQRMAVVRTDGDPQIVSGPAIEALYGAVYRLRALATAGGRTFSVGPLRARLPNAHLAPKSEWITYWALPIPNETLQIPKDGTSTPIAVEVWLYGTVAEILHVGAYSEEEDNIRRLHEYIAEHGYEIAGAHEEEYLTPPDAAPPKTIIRYPIRAKLA
ncbi:MAG: GyrI-like domain-containing protein [Actinomycetota bacterium]